MSFEEKVDIKSPKILKELKEEVDKQSAKLKDATDKFNTELRKTKIHCVGQYFAKGCGKWPEIGKSVYLTTKWWSNEVYSEGWRQGEEGFVCPHCNCFTPLIKDSWVDNSELKKLKNSFKCVQEREN